MSKKAFFQSTKVYVNYMNHAKLFMLIKKYLFNDDNDDDDDDEKK